MTIIDVEPVLEFLNSLDPVTRAKAYRGIELLANHWPLISEPYVKRVSGSKKLWELRERYHNTLIRLFFFQYKPDTLVMINGYVKKSNKVPAHILKQTVQKMKEYQARSE
jgi:phage-related protein